MRYRNLMIFGTASLLLSGCGPSNEEVARAVMMAAPIAYLAGMGIMALMLFLWRKLEPRLGINWTPVLLGLALACVIGLLSFTGSTPEPEFLAIAIGCYGASYLALLLVIWRIWLWERPATAFTWAWAPVLFVMLAPCPLILASNEHSAAMNRFAEASFSLWILPGYAGLVTGPLLLLALIEVWVRIAQRKRKEAFQKPLS